MNQILEKALKLSVGERIRLADALYLSVGGPGNSTPLTDAQIAELQRRIEYHREHPDDVVSSEEAKIGHPTTS